MRAIEVGRGGEDVFAAALSATQVGMLCVCECVDEIGFCILLQAVQRRKGCVCACVCACVCVQQCQTGWCLCKDFHRGGYLRPKMKRFLHCMLLRV